MKVNKDNFNSSKLKNNSLLSRFLNDKKSTIITHLFFSSIKSY